MAAQNGFSAKNRVHLTNESLLVSRSLMYYYNCQSPWRWRKSWITSSVVQKSVENESVAAISELINHYCLPAICHDFSNWLYWSPPWALFSSIYPFSLSCLLLRPRGHLLPTNILDLDLVWTRWKQDWSGSKLMIGSILEERESNQSDPLCRFSRSSKHDDKYSMRKGRSVFFF